MVGDFRLSFIWVESMFYVFTGAVKPVASFDFLESRQQYSWQFDQVLGGSVAAFEVPWQNRKKQVFWKYYLGSGGLEQASGAQASSHFVPLKSTLPFVASNRNFKSVSLEGFYYPHAFSVIITCRFSGNLGLTRAVDLAYAIRQGNEKFVVQQKNVSATSSVDLDSLLQDLLTYMRQSALGNTAKPGRSRGLFTIFTVVRADSFTEFQPGGPIHHALHTVTEWPPDPVTSQLFPPEDVMIPIKGATASGSILVGRQRTRAVWFPGLFSQRPSKKPSLGCYHRNQCFSAMQVESLSLLVRCTLDLITTGTPFYKLKPAHRASAMDVNKRLEELYLADRQTQNTYRSCSVRKQIEQNDLKQINDLRRVINPASQNLPLSQQSSG